MVLVWALVVMSCSIDNVCMEEVHDVKPTSIECLESAKNVAIEIDKRNEDRRYIIACETAYE